MKLSHVLRRSLLKLVLNWVVLSRIFPLMTLLVILGCGTSRSSAPVPEPVAVDVSCDEFDEQPEQTREITVDGGSTFTVALCANPTTGFQWEDMEVGDPDVLEEVSRDYQAPDSDALGASGRDVWAFDALTEGQTTLSSSYGQPWEGGTQGHWTFELSVTVE